MRPRVPTAIWALSSVLAVLGFVAFLLGGERGLKTLDGIVDPILKVLQWAVLAALGLFALGLGVALVSGPFTAKGKEDKGWGKAVAGVILLYFLCTGVLGELRSCGR